MDDNIKSVSFGLGKHFPLSSSTDLISYIGLSTNSADFINEDLSGDIDREICSP